MDKEKPTLTKDLACVDLPETNMLPGAIGEQYLPSRNAWVSCDDCHKWRRIPAEHADIIEEIKCTWYNIINFSFNHLKDSGYTYNIKVYYFTHEG